MIMITEEQLRNWSRVAYLLGCDKARTAASWVTDGNESDESRRYKLQLICEGDPLMDNYLPKQPDLSGEYADDWNDKRLIEEVTGYDYPDGFTDEEIPVVSDRLAGAFLDGVTDTFLPECERELLRWVGSNATH